MNLTKYAKWIGSTALLTAMMVPAVQAQLCDPECWPECECFAPKK